MYSYYIEDNRMTTRNYLNFKTVNEIIEFQSKLKTDQANILRYDNIYSN